MRGVQTARELLWDTEGLVQLRGYLDPARLARKLVRTEGTLVLSGGTVIDGTGRPPIPDAVVLIKDGRISAVGPRASTKLPPDPTARTIDTTGRWLIPGLIDCHVHFTGDHVEIERQNQLWEFNETST